MGVLLQEHQNQILSEESFEIPPFSRGPAGYPTRESPEKKEAKI